MESKDTTSKVEEQGLKNVKSHYIILKFFEYLTERKYLETIRYNKSILNHKKSKIPIMKKSSFNCAECRIFTSSNYIRIIITIVINKVIIS